jgi:hypothetical protein
MVRARGTWGLLVTVAVTGPACSQIAGIADYRNGSIGDAAADADGSSSNAPGDGGAIEASVPACPAPDVALVIDVVSSSSTQFTGVTDNSGSLFMGVLGVGHSIALCVPTGTTLDLRVAPDDTDALHDWGGQCGMARRCEATVTQQTILDVKL